MARPNEVVAAWLQEYADLVSITGGDAYRVRVYDQAARSVAGYHADISGLDRARLQEIPHVGGVIADKILEYLHSGRVEAVERLRAKVPRGVRELTAIPTLGPRKAMLLHQELGVSSVAELARAIEDGRLAGLRGFGAKTAENLRRGIELLHRAGGRVLISTAMAVAEEIVGELSGLPGCVDCSYAGSLRRIRESIGEVDILAASRDPAPLLDAFIRLPLVAEVTAHGPTSASVHTRRGLPVDLRVVAPEVWGAALQYFTGSRAHQLRIREIAVRKGLTLTGDGLFRVEDGTLVVAETEPEAYQQFGLPWIPPTLREDRGEIEAALAGELPDLLTVAGIRGDLHTHTDLTDGVASLPEMLAAARAHGYRYYAVTDHAKNLPMQRMTDEKMLAQRDQLRALAGNGMTLLHGTELNIDPDGQVDWDAEFLSRFDLCVASVHSHFQQAREQMTRRLVRACENPYVNIIGHPMTRQIGKREPVDADFDTVFEAAARTGTAMEINSFPDRLDLNDELILRAKRFGVKFAVNTDAHATGHLDNLRYGVGMAQRGWLTAEDVINAWPLPKLRRFLAANRPASNRPAANRPAANRSAANRPAANRSAANRSASNRPAT